MSRAIPVVAAGAFCLAVFDLCTGAEDTCVVATTKAYNLGVGPIGGTAHEGDAIGVTQSRVGHTDIGYTPSITVLVHGAITVRVAGQIDAASPPKSIFTTHGDIVTDQGFTGRWLFNLVGWIHMGWNGHLFDLK